MQNGQRAMRYLQIVGFVLGLIAFLVSAAFIGNPNGDTFWKTGVGFMLSVITLNLLWPTGKKN
jgi:hypothetical protein